MDIELTKADVKGAPRVWACVVTPDAVATYTYGVQGGKLQTHTMAYTEGKVKRTALEQAVLEGTQKMREKIRQGYVVANANADGGGGTAAAGAATHAAVDAVQKEVAGAVLPMLAQTFQDKALKAGQAIFMQPKLDGVRALCQLPGGELTTRTRKPLVAPAHVSAAVRAVVAAMPPDVPFAVLDGELYMHGESFNTITGIVRRAKDIKDTTALHRLQYHVYDLVCPALPFARRHALLTDVVAPAVKAAGVEAVVVVVPTVRLEAGKDVADLQARVAAYHDTCTEQGYEGAMVRLDVGTGYELGKRSPTLLKVKRFLDTEFPFVRCEPEAGRPDLVGALVLRVPATGREFGARPAMTEAERATLWDTAPGTLITVKYFELTEGGVPRFPVAIGIRDDV